MPLLSDVVNSFDYVIKPTKVCSKDIGGAAFGEGVINFTALTVAFWARFTKQMTEATILSVYGSQTG